MAGTASLVAPVHRQNNVTRIKHSAAERIRLKTSEILLISVRIAWRFLGRSDWSTDSVLTSDWLKDEQTREPVSQNQIFSGRDFSALLFAIKGQTSKCVHNNAGATLMGQILHHLSNYPGKMIQELFKFPKYLSFFSKPLYLNKFPTIQLNSVCLAFKFLIVDKTQNTPRVATSSSALTLTLVFPDRGFELVSDVGLSSLAGYQGSLANI